MKKEAAPVDRREDKPILFFDGECGLCNRAVDYLMVRDTGSTLRFCSLQSDFARRKLGKRVNDLDTVYLWYPPQNHLASGAVFDRSDAILRAAGLAGGATGVFATGARIVPRFLRDMVYNMIAAHRIKWFGRRETCRLPNSDERQRFITD